MRAQKIGVVGGGLMGHGIAYLLAAAGHHAGIFEPSADFVHLVHEQHAETSQTRRCFSGRRRPSDGNADRWSGLEPTRNYARYVP